MERVLIIGCGGAGKSTLARRLGEKTGLPVVHLDQIWWAPGNWQHISREDFDVRLAEELSRPRWILDGNFNRTIEVRLRHCDTVIYLDFNRFVCLKNWIGRVVKNWGHAREDMGEGCNEWFDPTMLRWIWQFNKTNRERYYRLLSEVEEVDIIILKHRRQVERFLQNL